MNAILPEPWRITAVEGRLDLYCNDNLDSELYRLISGNERELELDELELRAVEILENLQDTLSAALTLPWPSVDGRAMALPAARTSEDALHLWFGTKEEDPVLAMTPILLKQVGE